MGTQKIERRELDDHSVEVVLDVGALRYSAVMFVDGAPVVRKTGFKAIDDTTKVELIGGDCYALVQIAGSCDPSVRIEPFRGQTSLPSVGGKQESVASGGDWVGGLVVAVVLVWLFIRGC